VFVKKWGSRGTGDGQFSLPVTIIMDSKGNERGNSRVQKFDSNGTFLLKFGSAGKGDGQFTDPEHLAIDSDGNVYVTDRKNNNIQVFKPGKRK
jgi:tripartite motif-containing protein 71